MFLQLLQCLITLCCTFSLVMYCVKLSVLYNGPPQCKSIQIHYPLLYNNKRCQLSSTQKAPLLRMFSAHGLSLIWFQCKVMGV